MTRAAVSLEDPNVESAFSFSGQRDESPLKSCGAPIINVRSIGDERG
jgi:hypothetical protein